MHITKQGSMITVVILCVACVNKPGQIDLKAVKQEVKETEIAFAAMASQESVPAAFLHFAAEDVVLSRGKKLIHGKEEMQKYFAAQTLTEVKLSWEPSFVDVATSGDLAYTYGPYTFSARDTSGSIISDTGYFHTVWRKQEDGQWKFVWD